MYGVREGIRTLRTRILSPIRMPDSVTRTYKMICMVGVSGIEPPLSNKDTD